MWLAAASSMAAVSLLFISPAGVAAAAPIPEIQPIKPSMSPTLHDKEIILNHHIVVRAPGFVYQNTTYLPIWYVMYALKQIGVSSTWNGQQWFMTLPSNIHPQVNLSTVNPGRGPKHIYIDGHDVRNAPGYAYQPRSGAATTYMPIWYVMQALKYEGVASKWMNGTVWELTVNTNQNTNPGTTTGVTGTTTGSSSGSTSGYTQQQLQASGVMPGDVGTGSAMENWYDNGAQVQLRALPYNPGNNLIPIAGHVAGAESGDVVVEVYDMTTANENWFYSIPVAPNGTFSATIEDPFNGNASINVGFEQQSRADFQENVNKVTYTDYANPRPTYTAKQMALLESWMVNYTENTGFKTLALQITASHSTPDGKIEAVHDWVADNVEYNFPAYNNNEIPWQQATQTLQTKVGVCQDESAIAAALLRSIGIPTQTIAGTARDPNGQSAGAHEWDAAWNGTRWLTFDATWDQVYDQGTRVGPPASIQETYFDQNAAAFAKTHTPNQGQWMLW